jgi:hypothetical protein
VFIVRWASSGLTRIRQRPVGSPPDFGGREELDAVRADIVGEDLAELVVRHLPDETRAPAHRRDPGHRIRRRSAAGLARRAHLGVKRRRALGVEHLHRALDQAFAREERILRLGDHVDHRIADRQHVQAGFSHRRLMAGMGSDGKPFLTAGKPVTHRS